MVMAPPAPPPAQAEGTPGAEPAAAPQRPLRGTMIGMAPPTFAPPTGAATATATGSQPPPAGSSPPPARAFGGTMLGMAPPTFPSPPPPPSPETSPQPGPAPAGGAPRIASAQKTVLGVARPGIAPLNPGQAKAATAPVATPAPAPQPVTGAAPGGALVNWQHVSQPAPASPRRPSQRRISLAATLAIVGAAVLLVMAVLAFVMLRGHGSVTARGKLDAQGNELLELTCSECPDGTKTWIDTGPVAFQSSKATLKLKTPLKVGDNPIVLVLERPGRSREEIALALPIEFRVRGSTEQLAQDSPKVSVLASVRAGTQLEVDGKPVAADPNGSVRFDYDVASELTGPEATVKTLQRNVPYKATPSSGTAETGEVQIRIGITPLVVDAPGSSIVVGSKDVVIAGRTAPGAVLQIGAQVVALDPEGRFVSRQTLSTGENSFMVRSTLKDHAPRLVKVGVRRSDNLDREAALARSMTQTSYAEAAKQGDASAGRSIWLSGQLFDERHDGYTSVLLVDVKDGCKKGPCLAKVVYGVQLDLDKGRQLKAFGKVVRFVDGPRTGERIPEVRAELVVPGDK